MKLFKPPRFLRLVYNKRTWDYATSLKQVFLTFDDGPNPEITPFVLDELKKYGIRATFFCVGENVRKYPEIYKRILEEGHRTGNHTMRHENALKTNPVLYLKSIEQANVLINSSLFRPPYGRLSPQLSRKIARKYQIVMWSWLSYDFDPEVSTAEILEKANKQIKTGDVLVLHDNAKISEKQRVLLPQLLSLLTEKGFGFGLLT